MEKSFRMMSLVLVAMMALTALIGCTPGSNADKDATTSAAAQTAQQEQSQTEAATTAAEKKLITYKGLQWGWEFPEGDRIIKHIEDKFKVRFEFISPSFSDWRTKLNVMISSGSSPDFFPTFGNGDPDYDKYARDGVLLDLTEIVSQFPKLKELSEEETIKFYKTGDKLYGLPRRMGDVPAHALYIREDWLEELGLAAPTTWDELAGVLKAFVDKKPDGKKNVGLSVGNIWWFNYIISSYTGMWEWGLKDGKYVHSAVDPGFKEALKYLHNLYKNKCLDPDFALGKDVTPETKFPAQKAGAILYGFGIEEYPKIEQALKNNAPDAKIKLMIPPLKGPAGGFTYKLATPFFGLTSLKADIESPERLLEVMDYIISDEGLDIMRNGIEGVHYTKQDGKIVRNEEEYKKDQFNTGESTTHNLTFMISYDYSMYYPENIEYNKFISDGINALKPFALSTAVYGFSSENFTKVAPAMDDVYKQYLMKFIVGELDIDAKWDEYIDKYKKAGYEATEKEVNDYMANLK